MALHEIILFLALVRTAHAAGRLKYRRGRDKNIVTLASLGISASAMFEIVVRLEPEQALGLPWKSRHPEHPEETTCEFGTTVESHEIYVKVCIVGLDDGAAGAVISFHVAEKPFVFPYK